MLTETHRDKIRKSNILNALIEHAEGQREMSATQVSAGLGLLKKALPDLASVELKAEVEASDTLKDFLARMALANSATLMPADDGDN